jgi:hypothetical protein
VSGYLITSLPANLKPLPPEAEYGWWYQYSVVQVRLCLISTSAILGACHQ